MFAFVVALFINFSVAQQSLREVVSTKPQSDPFRRTGNESSQDSRNHSTLLHQIPSEYLLDPYGRTRDESEGNSHKTNIMQYKTNLKNEQISLEGVSVKYNCYSSNTLITSVSIWWGFTDGAGQWACNAWVPACKNSCVVNRNSRYQCKNTNGNAEGWVNIWWGFSSGDGKWACTNWVPACKQGNCEAVGFPENFWFSDEGGDGAWNENDKAKVVGYVQSAIDKMKNVVQRKSPGTEEFRIANNAFNFLISAKITLAQKKNQNDPEPRNHYNGNDFLGIGINPNTAYDTTLVHEAAHCCGHKNHPESRLNKLDLDRNWSGNQPPQAFLGSCEKQGQSNENSCSSVQAGSCKTFQTAGWNWGGFKGHDQFCLQNGWLAAAQVECAIADYCNIWGNPQDWLATEATGKGLYVNRPV